MQLNNTTSVIHHFFDRGHSDLKGLSKEMTCRMNFQINRYNFGMLSFVFIIHHINYLVYIWLMLLYLSLLLQQLHSQVEKQPPATPWKVG